MEEFNLANGDLEIQAKKATFIGTDEEQALIAPDGFESCYDAIAFINQLGNCSLLDKSFNISKSDKPMRHFLEQVHEFLDGIFQASCRPSFS